MDLSFFTQYSGMEIIHVSAECYPVAKAGGLGDVVGSLPKYQAELGHVTKVVMPMYRTKFLYENNFDIFKKVPAGFFRVYFIICPFADQLGFHRSNGRLTRNHDESQCRYFGHFNQSVHPECRRDTQQ